MFYFELSGIRINSIFRHKITVILQTTVEKNQIEANLKLKVCELTVSHLQYSSLLVILVWGKDQ